MLLHGCGLGEVGVGSDEHNICTLVFPHGDIESSTARSYCLRSCGSDTRIVVWSAAWSPKRRIVSAANKCSAHKHEVPSTVNLEGVHCEEKEGGQKNTTGSGSVILLSRIKRDGGRHGVSTWGGRCYASQITRGAVFRVRYPTSYLLRGPNLGALGGNAFA